MTVRLFTLALVGALTGCGSADTVGGAAAAEKGSAAEALANEATGSGDAAKAHCDATAVAGYCDDYTAGYFVAAGGEDMVKMSCMDGTYVADSGCTTEGRVATCQVSENQVRYYYSAGGTVQTADSAKSDCDTLGGKIK